MANNKQIKRRRNNRTSIDDLYYEEQRLREMEAMKIAPKPVHKPIIKPIPTKKKILNPKRKTEYTTDYRPATNNYINGLSDKEKAKSKSKIRYFCIKRMRAIKVITIDGIKLNLHKNKTLFNEYAHLYGTNVVDDYFAIAAMHIKRKNIKLPCKEYVYFFVNMEHKLCKIGVSNNPARRISGVQTGFPYKLTILGFIEGDKKKETYFHKMFKEYWSNGEWFRIEGRLEKYLNTHFPESFDEDI